MKNQYILFEMASGYSLFHVKEVVSIEALLKESTIACADYGRFHSMVSLVSFAPFTTADMAIENISAVTKGEVTPFLANFLKQQIGSKKEKSEVGVADPALGQSIKADLGIACVFNDGMAEIARWIRYHIAKFIPELKDVDITQAQLGLAHAFSRTTVKMNVHRSDNMIIQAISLLDQMDKDINTFAMRVKEWYGWHFPELKKLVNDNCVFCRLCVAVKDKKNLASPEMLQTVTDICGDEDQAKDIQKTASISMGMDFTEPDFLNIEAFAKRVVTLTSFRKTLHGYLVDKMNVVAPNLAALMGEQIGGRLICQAGSLTNLAKYPASTVQILGAEKALFRALKTKGNTPKYGLIFHSSYIGRAPKEHKGRISRYLANKASIASRLDCFMDEPNRVFGEVLANQVEDRLKFFETGQEVPTNQEIMDKAMIAYKESLGAKPDKKRKREDGDGDDAKAARKAEKKAKKEKKAKAEAAEAAPTPAVEEKKKKKKKDKSKGESMEA
uniref:Nucleolar protein 56 n=1 Tax=Eutreptiella gymnastica TaxID=73025 RepID=A0A6U7TPT5_9EUGL|mmetsp:Transcript_111955/g.194383  ORF Transcript_111955/g.194383 Transcript_111955/m.194383 type:complete len:500 (+) Transcript_111955:40-1539(+)